MEFIFALIVFALAVAGIGLGTLFGRAPVQSSCGSAACLPRRDRCTDCPNRIKGAGE
ncbi:MAG: hypothetical protein Q4F71_01885 [Paracoccus sp. (in: a-proteobacteria)]|nr:hypothetical protein [Paracoccus sp. (in: a-proteobacteria)]